MRPDRHLPAPAAAGTVLPAPAAPTARRLLPAGGYDALNRIAELAARLVAAPSAQVSLLTDVQTVIGGAGLPAGSVGACGPLEDSLCTVTAASSVPLLIPDTRADARVSALTPVTSGAAGAYLGVPLGSDSGEIIGALCVFDPERRAWSDADTAVLQQLADFVRAELELGALSRDLDDNQARWELAVEAGDIGSFDWDLRTGELVWDDRLIAMYGYDVGDVGFDRSIASVQARVHPDDAELVDTAMSEAIAAAGPLHVLYRVLLPDGEVRWLEARGRALSGPDGSAARLLGVSWDVTAERDNEARADRVLASMSVGYLAMDEQWRVTYVNGEGARLLGLPANAMLGTSLWELFPDTVDSVLDETYRRVAATRQPETLEAHFPAPANAWYEIRVAPDSGSVALYFLDITERRRTLELLQLSVDVSEQMVGAVSVVDAVAALARLTVPGLADWSIITLVDADGRTRDIQSWHVDPAMREHVERYARFRLVGGGSGAISDAVSSAAPVELPSEVLEFGLRTLPSAEARDALRTLAPESAVTIPLIADTAVLGVLTLCRGLARPHISAQELAVALTLCRRAGLAIDNARLYAAQEAAAAHDRTVAQALQQAMLTSLPQVEHLRLAARYLTAADGDQVGGDWYDAIAQPDGATTVVIGDVVGHDINAAATMGQLRTMLRMLTLRDGESPAQILRGLDHATHDLRLHALATLVTARIEPGGDGWTLRWSNAGHPPPIVLHADGTNELLDGPRPEMLLGVQSHNRRSDHTHALPAGSTVLLYTDGLIERRDHDLDDGIERLRSSLALHHALDPEALLDAILTDTVGQQPADDVAILAVRVTGPAPSHDVRVTLPADATAPRLAREVLAAGLADLPPDVVADALLLGSELITNALRHGVAPFTLQTSRAGGELRVGVTDQGDAMPRLAPARPPLDQPSGRGLLIVDTVAGRWGVTPTASGTGKTVWFTLPAT